MMMMMMMMMMQHRDPKTEEFPPEPVVVIGETHGRGDTDDFPGQIGPLEDINLAQLLGGDLFRS